MSLKDIVVERVETQRFREVFSELYNEEFDFGRYEAYGFIKQTIYYDDYVEWIEALLDIDLKLDGAVIETNGKGKLYKPQRDGLSSIAIPSVGQETNVGSVTLLTHKGKNRGIITLSYDNERGVFASEISAKNTLKDFFTCIDFEGYGNLFGIWVPEQYA